MGVLTTAGCLAQSSSSDGGVIADAGSTDGDAQPVGDGGGNDRAASAIQPPRGASSRGSGGGTAPTGSFVTVGAVQYALIVPSAYRATQATPLVIVLAGAQGAAALSNALLLNAAAVGPRGAIIAVVDALLYVDAAGAAAQMLDVRALQRGQRSQPTCSAMLRRGGRLRARRLQRRQSWFAALWGNDLRWPCRSRGRPGSAARSASRPGPTLAPAGSRSSRAR
ncbi:MAG: hypothetical protein IPG96_08355 [Proteobacteria bacterium]|nr:hypothetical protein [Pseudomonadota bacterium]